MRRVANIMIIAGVLGLLAIILYFVGTCAYTDRQQDRLGDEFAADNPGLAATEATVSEESFFWLREEDEAEREARLAELWFAAEYYKGEVIRRAGQPIGRIEIPKIGLGEEEDVFVVEGVDGPRIDDLIRNGPAHWPETKMPGAGGMVVISGHRTTYGAHFRHLDELDPGDFIELYMPYGAVRYEVTEVFIVDDDATETVVDRGKEQISLVACHPLSSSKQRIVAQGEMVSFYLYETEE